MNWFETLYTQNLDWNRSFQRRASFVVMTEYVVRSNRDKSWRGYVTISIKSIRRQRVIRVANCSWHYCNWRCILISSFTLIGKSQHCYIPADRGLSLAKPYPRSAWSLVFVSDKKSPLCVYLSFLIRLFMMWWHTRPSNTQTPIHPQPQRLSFSKHTRARHTMFEKQFVFQVASQCSMIQS